MLNRRTFLKVLAGIVSLPVTAKAISLEQPEPDQLTDNEYQLVKAHMKKYLSLNDIRWKIPGERGNVQKVAILDHNYIVTWKYHPSLRRAYIEVERSL